MPVKTELNIHMFAIIKLHHESFGDRKSAISLDTELSTLLARYFNKPPNKLTFCGQCYGCGRLLDLITVCEYFTDEILGYRGYCNHCNKKTEQYGTLQKLIDNPC